MEVKGVYFTTEHAQETAVPFVCIFLAEFYSQRAEQLFGGRVRGEGGCHA